MMKRRHISGYYWMVTLLIFICSVYTQTSSSNNGSQLFSSLGNSSISSINHMEVEERIYNLNRVGAAGCPYTATWLVHINLFLKTKVWLDSTKMEAASFLIYGCAGLKFQLTDSDAYYVHHMSRYEHLVHKMSGFEAAKNKTLILSKAAYNGECGNLQVNPHREYLAIVPFYGGLPPNVTKDLSVKSIGQGNSLVDAGTKALQCMAMLCSVLKYYGHVAIGVTRTEDRELMIQMIDQTNNPKIKERIHIVQFQMNKPANLPFHLMAWAQKYIQWYNCQGSTLFPNPNHGAILNSSNLNKVSESHVINSSSTNSFRRRYLVPLKSGKRLDGSSEVGGILRNRGSKNNIAMIYSTKPYASPDIFANDSEVFKVCSINFERKHVGGPVHVIYHRRSLIHHYNNEIHSFRTNDMDVYHKDPFFDLTLEKTAIYRQIKEEKVIHRLVPINYFYPIRYVYYSECDQTVHYDSMTTFEALSASSNDTTFFTGKRREKDGSSDPEDYLGALNIYRQCGIAGYSLHWPKDHFVRYQVQ